MGQNMIEAKEEIQRVDYDLFQEYRRKFGGMDTIQMPVEMTPERLNDLMRRSVETGVEIDYRREGWPPDPPADVLI